MGAIRRQTPKKLIDGLMQRGVPPILDHQSPFILGQQFPRRDQITVVGLNHLPMPRKLHRHFCVPRQEFLHVTGVIGAEMLDDDESGARLRRERTKESFQRRESAGRGTDGHDAEFAELRGRHRRRSETGRRRWHPIRHQKGGRPSENEEPDSSSLY